MKSLSSGQLLDVAWSTPALYLDAAIRNWRIGSEWHCAEACVPVRLPGGFQVTAGVLRVIPSGTATLTLLRITSSPHFGCVLLARHQPFGGSLVGNQHALQPFDTHPISREELYTLMTNELLPYALNDARPAHLF